jgi:hypothetical protein
MEMKETSLFPKLRPSAQLVFALVVALSFCAYLLIPTVDATAASCPPGWMSCGPWYTNDCCQHWPSPTVFVHRQQDCTTWDHDIDAYPTCTYKIVGHPSNHVCTWTVC